MARPILLLPESFFSLFDINQKVVSAPCRNCASFFAGSGAVVAALDLYNHIAVYMAMLRVWRERASWQPLNGDVMAFLLRKPLSGGVAAMSHYVT